MKKQGVHLQNNIHHIEGIQQELSFVPLQAYLQQQLDKFGEQDGLFMKLLLDRINALQEEYGELNFDNQGDFHEVFTLMYHLTTNAVSPQANHWSLGYPIPDYAFFGQDSFYEFLQISLTLVDESIETPLYQDFHFPNKVLYLLILERLYTLPSIDFKQLFKQEIDGVANYYQLKLDFTFVEVAPIEDLPLIDLGFFREREIKSFDDISPLLESIDLSKFKFSGITIIKYLNKTREHMSFTIQRLINNLSYLDKEGIGVQLAKVVQTITGSNKISCSFIPLLEMNGYPLFSSGLCENSVYIGKILNKNRDIKNSQLYDYLQKPYTISHGVGEEFNSLNKGFQEVLKKEGIYSYVCFPLKQEGKLVGFLEVYSKDHALLPTSTFLGLTSYLALFTQLASDIINKFKNALDKIILENYTTLQPSVQWRFNQVASRFLSAQAEDPKEAKLEKIDFQKVYPLHGNIDIRNSTKLRNFAYRQDSFQRIGLLQLIVDQIEFSSHKEIHDRFIKRFNMVKTWLDEGRIEQFLLDILSFFQQDVQAFLSELNLKDALLQRYKQQYLANERGLQAENNKAVNDFEKSLNMLNSIINEELVAFNGLVQQQYPSYFEKFRTDGIEYDIFIGQSIMPTKFFDDGILLDLRKRQIISMAEIARKTYKALDILPVPIVTTQLIFVHPNPIDITFRPDEKRFDVEGSYNIRYEVVKKRLDKALVKGTLERLVHPNMIAIVYSTDKVEQELREILEEVAMQGYIHTEFEAVEIDELQGVEDLKAFRVQVNLKNMEG